MKRLRRILKWTAIALLSVISVVILVVALLNWRASRRVEARLAPLREMGKPLRIEDLATSPVPDERNAAEVVKPLRDAFDTFEKQLAKAHASAETDQQYEAASIEVARMIDKEYPQLNAQLRAACGLTDYQPNYDFSNGPTHLMQDVIEHGNSVRTHARILYGHGLMSLVDGKTDEAMRDAIAMLRWSEHISQQPLLINYLVSGALFGQATELLARGLYANDASPEVRSELIHLFNVTTDDAKLIERFLDTLDTERAFGVSSFDSFPLSRFRFMLGELSSYLDVTMEMEAIATRPSGIAPATPQTKSVFAGSTWAALRSALIGLRRRQATSRAIRVLTAWQDRGADVNMELDQLELPRQVTTDPFDGSKLKLKTIGGSIAVYSVGEDLVDDGGTLSNSKDVGIAPN